jgi:hypothetical protein
MPLCTLQAIAVLKGDSKVSGTITFTQDDKGGPVSVTGKVSVTPLRVVGRMTCLLRASDTPVRRSGLSLDRSWPPCLLVARARLRLPRLARPLPPPHLATARCLLGARR